MPHKSTPSPHNRAPVEVTRSVVVGKNVVRAKLVGTWSIDDGLSDTWTLADAVDKIPRGERAHSLEFDCSELAQYDSSLICYVVRCSSFCAEHGIDFCANTLPSDVEKLFKLATERGVAEDHKRERALSFFESVGEWGESVFRSYEKACDFIGKTASAIWKMLHGKARFRARDCAYFIEQCGVNALPIITLISFITGMILAYIGAMQLQRFGAVIFVANLIAIAMVREMGVIMVSVIMCGRTGSAFAAQIGSMQASEEISALRVLGVDPVEYLVLPRIIALTLMLPLLTIYSDFIGMLGGLFVMGAMDITPEQYWTQVAQTLTMAHIMSGVIKSVVFGFLVAWAGCYRGIIAGKSSLAIGEAATSAAVLGMVLIVIGDGAFAVIFNTIGF
ncbi:MAG: ABC transporter permease [Opitutae bacterium]|nr:ABC transporter permease [Opitutae bacterium]MCD8298278.1 ABC transporter permease [Opitutae bacterium]